MRNKKAVFFDLDGTLLPIHQDTLFGPYFELLKKSEIVRRMEENGGDGYRIFMDAAGHMMENRGAGTNEAVFFERIEKLTGRKKEYLIGPFEDFYATVFGFVHDLVEKNGIQRRIVETVRAKGYIAVLATMPVFPLSAAVSRLSAVGLRTDDFSYISHYGNSTYLKPNPEYYREILRKMSLGGKECIMVGNSVEEDMSARSLGFDVFLVTGHEIGLFEKNEFKNGDLPALLDWAGRLPRAEV